MRCAETGTPGYKIKLDKLDIDVIKVDKYDFSYLDMTGVSLTTWGSVPSPDLNEVLFLVFWGIFYVFFITY